MLETNEKTEYMQNKFCSRCHLAKAVYSSCILRLRVSFASSPKRKKLGVQKGFVAINSTSFDESYKSCREKSMAIKLQLVCRLKLNL